MEQWPSIPRLRSSCQTHWLKPPLSQLPLPPSYFPLAHCFTPTTLHPSLLYSTWLLQGYIERHWVCERNRVHEHSIRMRAVLESPKHTNKPVCWRVWHTLTWPYGPGFICCLTNCSSKVPLKCVAQNINKDQKWRAIRIPLTVFL